MTRFKDVVVENFVESCHLDGTGWFWMHGHVKREKIRGAALGDYCLRSEQDVEPREIFAAPIKRGWVVTIDRGEGDDWGCAPGTIVHFSETPIEGDTFEGHPILDGPHEVTWMEVRR